MHRYVARDERRSQPPEQKTQNEGRDEDITHQRAPLPQGQAVVLPREPEALTWRRISKLRCHRESLQSYHREHRDFREHRGPLVHLYPPTQGIVGACLGKPTLPRVVLEQFDAQRTLVGATLSVALHIGRQLPSVTSAKRPKGFMAPNNGQDYISSLAAIRTSLAPRTASGMTSSARSPLARPPKAGLM